MARDAFGDRGEVGGLLDGALEGGGMSVVAVEGAGARIGREVGGGEGILPGPFRRGGRVLAVERVGEIDRSEAGGKVLFVEEADAMEVFAQGREEGVGEHGETVFEAFAIADGDLAER